jgi:tryptophan-rich sensory protein
MTTIAPTARRSRGIGMLVASLTACFAVAALGGYWTSLGLGPWYDSLSKPAWTPPNRVFGPVWTTLYTLMGVASWLVWRVRERSGAKVALRLYAVQLTLNLAWSGIFFGLRSVGWGFAEVALLWASIAATIVAFARVRPVAAGLLVPYLAWVSYASLLNFALWRLNG